MTPDGEDVLVHYRSIMDDAQFNTLVGVRGVRGVRGVSFTQVWSEKDWAAGEVQVL